MVFCENGHRIIISEDDKGNFKVPKECPEPGCSVPLLKFRCPCCGRYHGSDKQGICPIKKIEISKEIRNIKLISKFKKSYRISKICEAGIIASKLLFYVVVIIAAIKFSPSPEAQPLGKWMVFLSFLVIPIGGLIFFGLKKKKHKNAELEAFLKDEAPDLLPNLKELSMGIRV